MKKFLFPISCMLIGPFIWWLVFALLSGFVTGDVYSGLIAVCIGGGIVCGFIGMYGCMYVAFEK